jgi:hypothetical protein
MIPWELRALVACRMVWWELFNQQKNYSSNNQNCRFRKNDPRTLVSRAMSTGYWTLMKSTLRSAENPRHSWICIWRLKRFTGLSIREWSVSDLNKHWKELTNVRLAWMRLEIACLNLDITKTKGNAERTALHELRSRGSEERWGKSWHTPCNTCKSRLKQTESPGQYIVGRHSGWVCNVWLIVFIFSDKIAHNFPVARVKIGEDSRCQSWQGYRIREDAYPSEAEVNNALSVVTFCAASPFRLLC